MELISYSSFAESSVMQMLLICFNHITLLILKLQLAFQSYAASFHLFDLHYLHDLFLKHFNLYCVAYMHNETSQ
jgi:hypothetical protein